MDPFIFDDAALSRPISFALNLRRLPVELVHNVLDELPLVKVLQILAHKDRHLNDCVTSHRQWRRLFNSQREIDYVVEEFVLYNEICRFTSSSMKAAGRYFPLGCNAKVWGYSVEVHTVREDIIKAVKDILPHTAREVALLAAHSDKPYPGQYAELREIWAWVKEAKRQQNKAKSQQLTLVANVLAKYPEMIMVKKTSDPDRRGPRKNLKHIEARFRLMAKESLHNSRLRFYDTRPSTCRAGNDNIELVPYDRYLWLFLDTLKAHPYDESAKKATTRPRNSFDDKPIDSTSVYPTEICDKLDKVLEGLAHVYTGCPELIIDRISWDDGTWLGRPSFRTSTTDYHGIISAENHRCGVKKVMTYDQKEYIWLTLFLEVVTWMEQNFKDVEVPKG